MTSLVGKNNIISFKCLFLHMLSVKSRFCLIIWFDLLCWCTDSRLAARICAASPLREPWHLSSRGRHFSMQDFFLHKLCSWRSAKGQICGIFPRLFGSNGILWDTSRISAHLNCHRKDIVIKYLESGHPKIASLLINANTSFVCSLSASLRAEMNF